MQDSPHQMEDYLRKYCFSQPDSCRKHNLKNTALTCVTLEKNNKLDTSHSFTHFQTQYGKIQIFLNINILHNVNLKSWQIASSKSASSTNIFFNRNISSNCLEQAQYVKWGQISFFSPMSTRCRLPNFVLWHPFLLYFFSW